VQRQHRDLELAGGGRHVRDAVSAAGLRIGAHALHGLVEKRLGGAERLVGVELVGDVAVLHRHAGLARQRAVAHAQAE